MTSTCATVPETIEELLQQCVQEDEIGDHEAAHSREDKALHLFVGFVSQNSGRADSSRLACALATHLEQ